MNKILYTLLIVILSILPPLAFGADFSAELKSLSLNGGIDDGKARLIIEAALKGLPGENEKLIFSTALQHSIQVAREKIEHTFSATFETLQGDPKEINLSIRGSGEIRNVTGENLQDWGVVQQTNGLRTLVLRPRKGFSSTNSFRVMIVAEQEIKGLGEAIPILVLAPPQPALFNGYVKVTTASDFEIHAENPSDLVPIEAKYLPQPMQPGNSPEGPEPLAFRFLGSAYSLPLRIRRADPEARRVVLRDFKLTGDLRGLNAAFDLAATAKVKNPKGGSIRLLSGSVGLTEITAPPGVHLRFERAAYYVAFDRDGEFPIRLRFNAAVIQSNNWKNIDFTIAPSGLQPITLAGLRADTQFRFTGAARPERSGDSFSSWLPANGTVRLGWQESAVAAEGKLFYAAEMLSQINVSPGLMHQASIIDFRVMQGELSQVMLMLRGAGEVTRVQGDQVLAWKVATLAGSTDRQLVVQLNQPQKDRFALQIQTQLPLGAFPQAFEPIQWHPVDATRFAGYIRVVNEGAVRLEITQTTGLSQISPEQFPESDATKAFFRILGTQRFAYRFGGSDFGMKIQADQILPELGVSELALYHLGENELAIDAEIELEIREAPLRELLLSIPKGYGVAKLTVPDLADYFLRDLADPQTAELRLVYAKPVEGRQVFQLRLERNQALGAASWTLPRIDVAKAKSTRGTLAVSADAGYRLTPERTQAVTEIATALFPRKVALIQAAFRISEPAWQVAMRVERLPQTVQADAFHLFSIGEGIAYGSSVINYAISGAPMSAFRVDLSPEYFNVEFTGRDVRNWQKTTNGYLVQLHTPVAGAYTLLATYERPFKTQGEVLSFTGGRPLDAQSEQGYTLVISAYQFQVTSVDVSPGLLPLETGEVPAEYRLLFDAPILAAYRYTARPFNLRLSLTPLAQGESLSQVVDRASLRTRISKEGQVLTDVRYFVKNQGHPHFRLTLPEGTELWSATVNGAAVVPVTDARANLLPLPQQADPNALLTIDLKLAARSRNPTRISAATPSLSVPVMLADWKIEPDTGQKLVYSSGSLTPVGGPADGSGFAQVSRILGGTDWARPLTCLLAALLLSVIAGWSWRSASAPGVWRFSVRHVFGTLVGLAAFAAAMIALLIVAQAAREASIQMSGDITLVAPIQQPETSLSVDVLNLPEKASMASRAGLGWPGLLALVIWGYAAFLDRGLRRSCSFIFGWTLLAWAALRWPNGVTALILVLIAFLCLHLLLPSLRRLLQLPRKPKSQSSPPPPPGPVPAAAALILGGLLWFGNANAQAAPRLASPVAPERPNTNAVPESVVQQIRVEDAFAFVTTKLRWQAGKGQLLPILFEPAVLTRVTLPKNGIKLVQVPSGNRRAHQLLAEEAGLFDIDFQYQTHVIKKDGELGFQLSTPHGLINQAGITIVNQDVDVLSASAVSIERSRPGTNTVAQIVLAPVSEPWIGWKPRSRDVTQEKVVFYAEWAQVWAPSAGVMEGVHHAAIRPAQGELGELIFNVPSGATISDVTDVPQAQPLPATQSPAVLRRPLISVWRFDPDTRKLRVTLGVPQSKPFALLIRSQISAGPLPFERAAGLLSVENAAGQTGLAGVATANDVQLDAVAADGFAPINLEDFPGLPIQILQNRMAGLSLRRAFRHGAAPGALSIKASPVEPDVRVETQETLSLGEDRIVLATTATVDITRAGVFRLSFALPGSLEIESVSGQALSHWTETRSETNRVVTLHLRGKTEGQQQFAISLAGPGIKATNGWSVPQFVVREAGKQRGTLVIVPEQGMRLQAGVREGLTQLDPQKSGIRQKGVLAFRLLQTPWSLKLDVEQVDAWVQVTSLQHVTINEAQAKFVANLQYQIENTGLKSFRLLIATNMENVRFRGDQVADFLPVPNTITNGLQTWEVKLHRRVIGAYSLQVSYQAKIPEQAQEIVVRGLQAVDVNMQRGFVTAQSGGRLQLRVSTVPPALQIAEWQSIPRFLQRDLETASAHLAYRLVDPVFQLALQLERHPPAKLLPARVSSVEFTSVISDDGVMLTRARLEMIPGDKRLLQVTLPKGARFWFSFVNKSGVWPWQDGDRTLIPLEQHSRTSQALSVELYFSSSAGGPGRKAMDLELLAPTFDLPLENITWRLYLNEKWRLKDWSGTLQLQQDQVLPQPVVLDVQSYLNTQAGGQKEKIREAEQMLALGNAALEQGDPQQARRAFQAAFGLSQHDNAFNEDARVQLHNLKLQEALVGLNVRQSAAAGPASPLRDSRPGRDFNYSQQSAKQLIDRNTAEENAAFTRLAERLIQQQDAAVRNAAVIHAAIPEQGRLLTFKRAVAVDVPADLRIHLRAEAIKAASFGLRLGILAAVFGSLAALRWASNHTDQEN